jgi:hypothetical protein
MNNTNLSTDLLRRLALMQHLGEDYFIINGIAYEGEESAAKESFEAAKEDYDSFDSFCNDELVIIDELDIDDCYDVDYYVLTDSEADDKAKEYILDSLWAFTPNFLAKRTELGPEVFEAIQSNGKCEGNNDTIYNLVQKLDSVDDFVSAAIGADGRGHFLSSYDGCENEKTVNGKTFYIYRIN